MVSELPQSNDPVSNMSTTNSTTNSSASTFLTITLDGTNYPLWLAQIFPALKRRKLLKYVDGSSTCPPCFKTDNAGKVTDEVNPEFEAWIQDERMILSWINGSLTPSILSTVARSVSSRDTWVALARHYASLSQPDELLRTTKGDLSISDLLDKINAIADNRETPITYDHLEALLRILSTERPSTHTAPSLDSGATRTVSMASHAASSSSSSVSNNSFTYRVFLSFRGKDTRFHFTSDLYNALDKEGINTFMDLKLPKGEEISAELVKAIKESEISIIVFSENYADSRWCLDELVEILQCKASNQQQVRAIFYKVEPSDVRHQKGKFGDAFKKLDEGNKYKDNMAKWRTALSDAANLSGWTFSHGESEYQLISKIVKELSNNVLIPFNNLEVAKYPVGIDPCRQRVEKLLDMENDGVRMLGIWGLGGVGKSTIAKAVFNSIKRNFEGNCFLADVRSNSIPHGGLAKLQQILLSNILRDSYVVNDVAKGVTLIKEKLQRKRVLLVIDDVTDLEQLEKLAPSSDCFGPRSRILITTRDNRLLTSHEVDLVYEVHTLGKVQASELFILHAFKLISPPEEYCRLIERAVNYASGLPLALVVLGSHLFGRSTEVWEVTLNSCKGDHESKIGEVLRISYDALRDNLKEFFLDIACFFKGKDIAQVKPILDACHENLKPVIGLAQLQEKALIRIERVDDVFEMRDVIWMHDLIEEMGKDIGKRNRLWKLDDIDRALRENAEIRGIQVPDNGASQKMPLNANSLSMFKNLKYLSMGPRSFELSSNGMDVRFLSNELRWLRWDGCPFRSLSSNFFPGKLVGIIITYSDIERLWHGQKDLPSLKYLRFCDCESLVELPDFTKAPNLESLILEICTSLAALDESIGNLTGLQQLSIGWCSQFTTLPRSIYGLQNLQTLILEGCGSLTAFPTNTKNLLENNGGTLSLPRLKVLNISRCYLSDCDFLNTLDCLDTLTCLELSFNKFVSLPECISKFVKLEKLYLRLCDRLREVPELPPNLVWVDASDCDSLEEICDLSEVLKRQQITMLNLRNCRNISVLNIISLEQLLLNIQAKSRFRVSFPGTITAEDAKWLHCWRAATVTDGPAESRELICRCSITISKDLKWENLALAVIAESRESNWFYFKTEIFINEVSIWVNDWDLEGSCSSHHVWVEYIPLLAEMKEKVDDQKGYLRYYECVVQIMTGEIDESVGVHLVCMKRKQR